MVRLTVAARRFPGRESTAWFHDYHLRNGDVWLSAGKVEGGYLLHYPDLVDFYISNEGSIVEAFPFPGTPVETLQHLFLAQVWPMLLSHQGAVVLHASAVGIAGEAVVFFGHAGWGKSTLAASLRCAGHSLITDDILVVEQRGGAYCAIPSYAQQRLWPDAACALFGTPSAYRPVAHYTDKVSIDFESKPFASEPVPIRRLYFLQPPADLEGQRVVSIRPLSPLEGLHRLLSQTFRLDITDPTRLGMELEQLGTLVRAIPMRQLSYPRTFSLLDEVHRAVLDDVGATADSPAHTMEDCAGP